MHRYIRSVSIACLALVYGAGMAYASAVTVSGRKILLDGVPFTIKGVCYSPTPAGYTSSYNWWADAALYQNDFALLKSMGVNTIRTYNATAITTQFLDAAQANGIHVIMSYWVDPSKVGTTASETAMINSYLSMVNTWKSHPAVLMWMFGNEVDARVGDYGIAQDKWYTFLSSACVRSHAADPNHPVSTANQEINEIGDPSVKADTTTLAALDVWGVNVYRGSTFGNMFAVMGGTSTAKPYFVSEWGCDAYNATTHVEDQETQSRYIGAQWAEIAANLAADGKSCSGGTVFEWTDEWWKSFTNPLGNAGHDTVTDWNNATYDDPAMNEEWWGICGINANTVTRDRRLAYFTLKNAWYVAPPGVSVSDINPNVIIQGDVHSYPNPARGGVEAANIQVTVSGSPDIKVEIFDISGRKLADVTDQYVSGATRIFRWFGKDSNDDVVSLGLYICKITARSAGREEIKFRKIAIVK